MAYYPIAREHLPSYISSILASQSAAAEIAASEFTAYSAALASATSDAFDATATDDALSTPVALSTTSTTVGLATTATAATNTATNTATLEGVFSTTATPTSAASQASGSSTLLPVASDSHNGHSGMSHGALAAAVVVPLLMGAIFLFLAFTCLRRRRNRKLNSQHTRMPCDSGFEKAGARTSLQPPAALLSNNERNSAYFTGLDTAASADVSRGQSTEYYRAHNHLGSDASTVVTDPPPPYRAGLYPLAAAVEPSESARGRSSYVSPEIPTITREEGSRSPFTDAAALPPPSASDSNNGNLGTPIRPTTSRTISARSFTSTLYSDDASVHSATAHRVSISAIPLVLNQLSSSVDQVGRTGSDPFEDAGGSPVSPGETSRR